MTVKELKEIKKHGIPKNTWVKYMNRFDDNYQYAKVRECTDYGIVIYPSNGRGYIHYQDLIEILEKEDYPEYYI